LSIPGEAHRASTVVFDWDGNGVAGRYQICRVGRDGREGLRQRPHFLNFQATPGTEAIHFQLAPGELSHFELRRFGDRHTFYFDDVKLPNASTGRFREAPVVRVPVDGAVVDRVLSEYGPARVWLSLRKGACCNGISSSEGFLMKTPVEQPQTTFTVLFDVEGIAGNVWVLTYFRSRRHADRRPGGGSHVQVRHGYPQRHSEAATYQVPLDRIGAVEVRAIRRP